MNLVNSFDQLLWQLRPCFERYQTFQRARGLAFSSAFTYGRHTITRLICSKNEQYQDWSADYKFFSHRKWQPEKLFQKILEISEPHMHLPGGDVVIAIDETTTPKWGKKIPGVATLRDPMSLPFHVNLTRAIRYIQGACMITPENKIEYHRAIPIYFQEAAPAKKPKKDASQSEKERYREEQKVKNLSVQGHQAALTIRSQVDQLPEGRSRRLYITVDGSFANRNFLGGLPDNSIPIVRVRKDIKICQPASEYCGRGRLRIYGDRLPTPDEIRKDNDTYPYQTTRIFAAGKYHNLRYKTIAPILWQRGSGRRPCRLIIIAPLRYRRSQSSPLLYRKPANLLVLDTTVPTEQVLQYYFLRWDIEVNHRDEKSLLGIGDAQLRSPSSVTKQPQFSVAVYSLLLLASISAYGADRSHDYLPTPKWRKKTPRRPSTLDILSQFRREVMIAQLKKDLDALSTSKNRKKRDPKRPTSNIEARKRGFIVTEKERQSALKLPINVISAILYADS
jgi:hypothetical protein